jgi:two-component system chemotaxis response regulator CheB
MRRTRGESRCYCNRNFDWWSKGLSTIVEQLPTNLNAAIFVVLHISPHRSSNLPEILTKAGNLNAAHARDGEPIQHGRIYVAPPDRHLLLESGQVRVTEGAKENRFRPAIDPLFRSAAYAYGSSVIGVVPTGAQDDGTAGLWAIKDRGGASRSCKILTMRSKHRCHGLLKQR